MAKGKQLNERLKNLIIMEYASNHNYREVGRTFEISECTVRKMVKDNPDLVELYSQKVSDTLVIDTLSFKEEFLQRAESSINMAIDLSQQRIALALSAHDKFESIINDMLTAMRNGGVDLYAINDMLKSLSSIMNIPLKDLSTYIGTLYDKRTQATGGITNKYEIVGDINHDHKYEVEQALVSDDESKELIKQLYRRSRNLQEVSEG
jgi:hypothetical protein